MTSSEGLIAEIEHYLRLLELRIGKPFAIIDQQKVRGFRFGKPTVVHFVVISVARSLSLLNAMSELIDGGYQGEALILARTLIENESRLSYVVAGISLAGVDKRADSFLAKFFSDNVRDPEMRGRYDGIKQKDINQRNSEKVSRDLEFLRHFGLAQNIFNEENQHARNIDYLYATYSNHVHGRYPEAMDVYGEKSLKIQAHGNFESKDIDAELEAELLEVWAAHVSKGLRLALMHLTMGGFIELSDDEKAFCFDCVF